MFLDTSKLKIILVMLFLMTCYFIGINFLNELDKKNSNNVYVSLNLASTSKEDYITEYIGYIRDGKYKMAYNMLNDETKEYFGNNQQKYVEFAKEEYSKITSEMWKFDYELLSENNLKRKSIYTYKVKDPENDFEVLINKITINEYAINVFKISII